MQDTGQLTPDDAFAILGNEVRIQIIQALGESRTPLSHEQIAERVNVDDADHLNYHLLKLTGHFIERRDNEFDLLPPGSRILEAVLSGAVSEPVSLEPTELDRSCPFCGAGVLGTYANERVYFLCPGCSGRYPGRDRLPFDTDRYGFLGQLPLPSAGIYDRSIEDMWDVVWTYGHLEVLAAARQICPRCTGHVEIKVEVCDDHDTVGGKCPTCGSRFEVYGRGRCTNCHYGLAGEFVLFLLDETALLSFLTDHGINPIKPDAESPPKLIPIFSDYEEDVISTDPFEARFTFSQGGESIMLHVDDHFDVIDTERIS